MAFCINCGQKLVEGAKFCFECGAPVSHDDSSAQRRTVYDGNTYKCPNCGENLSALMVNCPVCGYELRNRSKSDSVTEFLRQLQEIESQVTIAGKKQKVNSNGLTALEEQKVNLISNFPVPNTKEDLFEFLVLASSNINEKRHGINDMSPCATALSDAWEKKFNQAYQKAKIFFGETMEFQGINTLYSEKLANIAKMKKKKKRVVMLATCGFILFWGIIFLVIMVNQA